MTSLRPAPEHLACAQLLADAGGALPTTVYYATLRRARVGIEVSAMARALGLITRDANGTHRLAEAGRAALAA